MNKKTLLMSIFLVQMMPYAEARSSLDYNSVWDCNTKKLNWYCDEKPPEAVKVVPKPKLVPPSADPHTTLPTFKDLDKLKTMEEFRQELKSRIDIATMYPTEVNVRKYMDANNMMLEKSTVFTDQWRRIVYQEPKYDYSIKNPSNNAAINVQKEMRQDQLESYMRNISREHGLIFFFRSDCPYCHRMAPTMKMISQVFGIEVLGVSIDGKGLPDFPNFKDGRAIAQKWGVEAVPATFIASKKTAEHAPIGFGMMSLSEIVERVWVLTNTKPGQEY